jgi:hypothetical protein
MKIKTTVEKTLEFLKNLKIIEKANLGKINLQFDNDCILMRFDGVLEYQKISLSSKIISDDSLKIINNVDGKNFFYSVEIEGFKNKLMKFKNKKITIEYKNEKILLCSDCDILNFEIDCERLQKEENKIFKNFLYKTTKKTEELQKIHSFVFKKFQCNSSIFSFSELTDNYMVATDACSIIVVGENKKNENKEKFYIYKDYIKFILKILKENKKDFFEINVTKETIDFDFGDFFLELTNKSVLFPEWSNIFEEENEKIEIKDFYIIKEKIEFYYDKKYQDEDRFFDFIFKSDSFEIFYKEKLIYEQKTDTKFEDHLRVGLMYLKNKDISEKELFISLKKEGKVMYFYEKNNKICYLLCSLRIDK